MQQQAINIQEPNWLVPIFTNIHEELKHLPWAVWKAEPKIDKYGEPTGKWSKAPRHPITGRLVGSNKPELFGTFEQARAAYSTGIYTGVGVLLTNSGIVGIDIDNGRTLFKLIPELKEWLTQVEQAGAYCEFSPSRNGLRIFIKGSLACNGMKSNGLEIYQDVRFLTVTGCVLSQGSSHD